MITALIVIAILVFLIVAHEFGHFLAAKFFGVKVEEFGVGYPPRAFTLGKLGDTEYTLNWIPFGGFVRLFGDEGQGENGKGALVSAARWKQAVILIAGVSMNVIAAWALFTTAFTLGVPQVVDSAPLGENVHLIITDVVAGSPAYVAGIQPGDEIVGLTDDKGVKLGALSPDGMAAFVSTRGGRPIEVEFLHAGEKETASIIPANAVIPGAAGRPALGVALALVAIRSEAFPEAAVHAFHQTADAFVMVGANLGSLIVSAFRGAPNIADVVGPVGIVGYVGDAAQNGVGAVLLLSAVISINLAVINLIPVPALDGGRLAVLLIESIRRKSVPKLFVQLLNVAGIVIIILLMVVVTYHDIARLFA